MAKINRLLSPKLPTARGSPAPGGFFAISPSTIVSRLRGPFRSRFLHSFCPHTRPCRAVFLRHNRALLHLCFSREAWSFLVPVPAHFSRRVFSVFRARQRYVNSLAFPFTAFPGLIELAHSHPALRCDPLPSSRRGWTLCATDPVFATGRFATTVLTMWPCFPFATISRYGRLRRPRISALVFSHTVCTPCRLAAQDDFH